MPPAPCSHFISTSEINQKYGDGRATSSLAGKAENCSLRGKLGRRINSVVLGMAAAIFLTCKSLVILEGLGVLGVYPT